MQFKSLALRIVSKIFFACFFVFSGLELLAQDSYKVIQPVDFVLKAGHYNDGSNEKQIFASLAINNIRNIYQVSLYLKGDLLISIRRDEGRHLFAYVKMIRPRLSGEIHFRDFLINTLLMPKAFEGKLVLKYKNVPLTEIPVEMLLSGGVLDLEAVGKEVSNVEDLSAEIKFTRFLYSDRQLHEFMKRAGAINTYYSYSEVLRLLMDRLEKQHLNRGKSSAATFIAWHEINRVKSTLETHHLPETLHLSGFDPKGLLNRIEQLTRLERRANTLFVKELETGRKGKLADRDKYCRDYAELSMKYIRLAENYPPNMVAAFNELVHIYPVEEDLNRVSNVAVFYDKFHISGVAETKQRIYNYFVYDAKRELEEEQFLNALALIRNAREFELFFNGIKRSEEFDDVYTKSLDGLMSSFLQVSVMAYKAHNYYKMAKRYYQNAQKIYDEHIALLGKQDKIKYSFRNFVEKQVELAGLLLDDRSYDEAITILDDAQNIISRYDLDTCPDMASKYKKGYTGIYEMLVDSVEYYLEKEKQDDVLSLLMYSADFEQSHADYLEKDERLTSYAYILYDKYYRTGEAKLNGRAPEEAIADLLEAKKINELFLKQTDTDIDSLISAAAVPQIMQVIKRADFEVWASHIDKAEQLKKEALDLQQTYHVADNQQINDALSVLEEKINKRVCVSVRYEIDNNCRVIRNRINSGKFKEAEERLLQSELLLREHRQCEVDESNLVSLKTVYTPLFNLLHGLDSLPYYIRTADFTTVRSVYSNLQINYEKNGLDKYVKKIPALEQLIEKDGNAEICEQAVNDYIKTGEWKTAFVYLDLMRKMGVQAKATKSYQKVIGMNLCKDKEDKQAFMAELTKNDRWFKMLRYSCDKKLIGLLR